MSRVHRYEDLESFARPTAEIFTYEADFVRQALHNMHEQGLISGGFLYGSGVSDATAESDIDLLVAAPIVTETTREGLRDISTTVYGRSRVPMDISLFTEETLASGRHGYYRRHLIAWFKRLSTLFPENIIGQNPVDIITPVQEDVIVAVDKQITAQRHVFEMEYVNGYHQNPEGLLGAVLNLPHKLGRECVGSLLVSGYISSDLISDAKKGNVAKTVSMTLGANDPNLVALYEDLAGEMDRYVQLVGEIGIKGITQSEYSQIIDMALATNLPKAIELTSRMQAAYRRQAHDKVWPDNNHLEGGMNDK